MELSDNERFIIEVFREFDFLRKLDYDAILVVVHGSGREGPLVVFENKKLKRTISISWEGMLLIEIERHRWFSRKNYPNPNSFYLHDFHERLNIRGAAAEGVRTNAELLKTKFMPIIKGEVWLDQMQKQSEYNL